MSPTERAPNLSASDHERLERVAHELRRGPDGIPALAALLATPSWAVRRRAVTALAELGGRAPQRLVETLTRERKDEGQIAGLIDALCETKGDVDAAVRALLAHEDPAVICDAAQILGRRRSREFTLELIRLTAHGDDNVALAAVEALGQLGGSAAVDCLAELSQSSNFFRAFPAIDVLGRLGDARAIPPLALLLKHPHHGAEAARALGRLGYAGAAPALIDLMAHGSDALFRVAALALSEIHAQASRKFGAAPAVERAVAAHPRKDSIRTRVLAALRGADRAEHAAFAKILGFFAADDQVPELIALLDGPEESVAGALKALSGPARAGDPRIIDALRAGKSTIRQRLLPLVGSGTWAVPVIVECLDDADKTVRVLACDALARIGATSAVEKLFQHLDEPELGVSQALTAAIQSLGGNDTERLAVAAAKSNDPIVKRAALRVICYFAFASGFPAVLEALRGEDKKLRDVAFAGLPLFERPDVPDILLELSRHASPRVRDGAIRAMGHMTSDPRLLDRLLEALDDEDPWVRYFACQAIGRWGRPEATDAVLARLGDAAGQVRVGVVDALARLPGENARRALAESARSDDGDVRRAALVAMGPSKHSDFFAILRSSLDHEEAATRLVALSSVAQFEGDEAVAALARAARHDTDPSVRHAAIELLAGHAADAAGRALTELLALDADSERLMAALARGGDSRVPAIADALRFADPPAASALAAALSRMQRPAAHALLLASLRSESAAARRAAAEALSVTLDPAAREALLERAQNDPDPEVRRMCGLALS